MTSPAKRHYQRKTAELEAVSAKDDSNAHGDTHDLLLAKLFEDTRRLKALESIKAKGELKLELLPEYDPYIDGVLTANKGGQDDILMTILVWTIDAAAIDATLYVRAINIAVYAIEHDLSTTDKYKRSTACLIVEEISEAAIAGLGMASETLLRIEELADGLDMPDQVRAKMHKALGLNLMDSKPLCALRHLETALEFDSRSGVKMHIKKLKKANKDTGNNNKDNKPE